MRQRERRMLRNATRPARGSGERRACVDLPSRRVAVGLLLGLCLVVARGRAADASSQTDQPPTGFRLVVHPQNPEAFATRDFVSDAFFKKVSRWPSGERLHPVDLRFGSVARDAFSETILRRSAAAVRHYWQQRIFTGRGVPPPEVESDAEVLRYVSEHSGSIGYISTSAAPANVKVLPIR